MSFTGVGKTGEPWHIRFIARAPDDGQDNGYARVFMLEHSVYSVISPEGCASILWRKNGDLSQDEFSKAADALKVTAQDLLEFGIIDGIIPEPVGGAHRDYQITSEKIAGAVKKALDELDGVEPEKLIEGRYTRLRQLGSFLEG